MWRRRFTTAPWRALVGAAGLVLMLAWAQAALAQSTTYRIEIRKADVVESNYTVYFSLLDSSQQAIKKIDLPSLKVLAGDNQDEVPMVGPEVKLLADTNKPVAVMFVVANYRAFNEKTTRSRTAAQEFVTRMRGTDIAGMVYYGTSFRELEFTQDTRALGTQIQNIQEGDDGEPRIFAALGQALRRFSKDLDQQSIELRYMIIISDGAGAWAGLSDQSRRDKKIGNFVTRAKELGVIPIVIGYTPLGDLDEDKLTMLRQLASRSGGTYREAADPEGVFTAVDAAYNEIYGSHMLTFTSDALEEGQTHKIRLGAKVDSLKLKSLPATVFVPESETSWGLFLGLGGGLCLIALVVLAIGAGIAFIIKKRRESADQEQEGDYYDPAGAPVAPGMAVVGAVAPAMVPQQQYKDEPPATYLGKLQARTGPLHGRTFYIVDETTTIGSAESNSIVLSDGTVSKKHAGIRVREGNRYELHDFGSTNGLFINDRRISKQFLKDGDVIKIGDTELIFHVE